MLGKNYDSLVEFQDACRKREGSLDPCGVLGKVYRIEQLRHIAKVYNIEVQDVSAGFDEEMHGHGVKTRYGFAKRMDAIKTPDEIGEALSRLDHEFHFPILTYFGFPDAEAYLSPSHFLKVLSHNGVEISDDYIALFNGITHPASRACALESVRIHQNGEAISLLFSCSRVLVMPEGQQSNFTDFFLSRIPVLVRILFRYKLIEMAMPPFSEPVGLYTDTPYKPPERYQAVAQSAQVGLINMISAPPRIISYSKITLYLEIHLNAIDMGWIIQPQSDAEFDLTQAAIPLRDILHSFSTSIQSECTRRDIIHPLATINLYKVFRALKEQSHTLSLMLEVQLGQKRGKVSVSTQYGRSASNYAPVLWLSKNDSYIAEKLRDAVHQSQVTDMVNPYDLIALLTGQDPSS